MFFDDDSHVEIIINCTECGSESHVILSDDEIPNGATYDGPRRITKDGLCMLCSFNNRPKYNMLQEWRDEVEVDLW